MLLTVFFVFFSVGKGWGKGGRARRRGTSSWCALVACQVARVDASIVSVPLRRRCKSRPPVSCKPLVRRDRGRRGLRESRQPRSS